MICGCGDSLKFLFRMSLLHVVLLLVMPVDQFHLDMEAVFIPFRTENKDSKHETPVCQTWGLSQHFPTPRLRVAGRLLTSGVGCLFLDLTF